MVLISYIDNLNLGTEILTNRNLMLFKVLAGDYITLFLLRYKEYPVPLDFFLYFSSTLKSQSLRYSLIPRLIIGM